MADRMKDQEKEQGMGGRQGGQRAPGRIDIDDETQGQRGGGVHGSDLDRDELEREGDRGLGQGREGSKNR